MPISESLYLMFNNVSSQTFDIINCTVDSGLYSETLIPDRIVNQTKVKNNPIPFFQGVEESSRVIKCFLAFREGFDEGKLRSVKRWLHTDFFVPLSFSEIPDILYYAICTNSSDLMHNGRGEGYIVCEFECDSPYAYSPIYSSIQYDLSTNPTSTTLKFVNNGDIPCKPFITVQVISGTSFSITNLSDGGNTISFSGLQVNEILEIDCENEDIKTSIPLTYRYDKMSGDFLSTIRGINRLKIVGNIKIQFKYQFRLL